MAVTATARHTTVVTLPDEVGAEVNKAQWNGVGAHEVLITGLGTAAEAATTDFCSSNDVRLSDSRSPSGAAGGNLSGTYPNPFVDNANGLIESAGPNALAMGNVPDGTFLKRVGFTIVGATGGAGDVTGPASSVNNRVAFFNGVTGKIIKDSGLTISGSNTGDQTSIVGITGTLAQFNTACTDADFASGGGTASGANTGDQTITLTGDVTGSGTGSFATTIGATKVTRAMLNADAKNWQFLGQATASGAVRTGTITWTGTFKQLLFEYFIAGYSNSAIGRLIVGPTAGLSETGTTFCTSLIEGVTITATSVSVPGWPTAVTVANVARYGWMYVDNVASVVKRMSGHGQHSGTAPTVVPTQMRMEGMFNDTTNLINKAELAVYAAITGATISAITFNAGTYLNVWGRNDD